MDDDVFDVDKTLEATTEWSVYEDVEDSSVLEFLIIMTGRAQNCYADSSSVSRPITVVVRWWYIISLCLFPVSGGDRRGKTGRWRRYPRTLGRHLPSPRNGRSRLSREACTVWPLLFTRSMCTAELFYFLNEPQAGDRREESQTCVHSCSRCAIHLDSAVTL